MKEVLPQENEHAESCAVCKTAIFSRKILTEVWETFEIKQRGTVILISKEAGGLMFGVVGHDTFATVEHRERAKAMLPASLKLMAAAPEMAALLNEWLRNSGTGLDSSRVFEVLKKAEVV